MRERRSWLGRFGRLVPYYFGAVLLGVAALYGEYRLTGNVLLVPAFNWSSVGIPGGTLASPKGEYSLSFKNTRLDWRLVSRGGGPVGPALTVGTASGWRLLVWETAPGSGPTPWGESLPAGNGLRRADDGVVRGAFRAGSKDVTLEFLPPEPAARPDETTVADMVEIVRSLKPSQIKAGPGD